MKNKYSIAASLKYGKYFSKFWIAFFYLFAILGFMAAVLLIAAAIIESVYEILLVLIIPLLGIPASAYVIVCYHLMSIRIKVWLQDAVKLEAKSVEIDNYISNISINKVTKSKIRVSFIYNGKMIVKCSGNVDYEKQNAHNTKAGFEGIFRKFANRNIKILYSPKFDQVLILKDQIS